MIKTPRVYLILRKNGDDRPRVQVECDLYSMNTYVDMLCHLNDLNYGFTSKNKNSKKAQVDVSGKKIRF